MRSPNARLGLILLAVALLLLIPFVAMQFTHEVAWSAFDFLIAGALLLSTGLACEAVLRFVHRPSARIALVLAILALLVVVWLEGAVGLFGSPWAGS